MKSRAVIALLLLLTATALAGSTDEKDPLVGRWIWAGNSFVTFNPDGTASNNNSGMKSTWTFNNNAEVQRKYRIIWNEGQFIDKAVLSEDRNTLRVENNNGVKFVARRAITSPGPGGSPSSPFGTR